LIKPSSRFTFERVVVHPSVEESVKSALHFITNREAIEGMWRLSKLTLMDRNVLNFYGPSGTGKTMLARCIARHLKKPLYQVDYATIISCLVGQTAKNIKQAFVRAKALDAILFFDEADSLCSRRVSTGDVNFSTGINQNRNVFMQELDRHTGIVLLATNFFENFDEALLRRCAANIEVALPDVTMRAKLFDLHIPNKGRCRELDLEKLGEMSETLSGGDILNVCINAIKRACLAPDPADWWLTQTALLKEIQSVREAKRAHGKGDKRNHPKVQVTGTITHKTVGGKKKPGISGISLAN
jgi:SpoVK/Ycf46/Vps4 family AAA+-type ATPase